MQATGIVSAMMIIMLAGCVKVPEKIAQPVISIKSEKVGGALQYHVVFKAGIENENNEDAFKDVTGTITLKDAGVEIPLHFKIPLILPFEGYTLTIEKKGSADEVQKIFRLLHINKSALGENEKIEEIEINAKYVAFKLHSYDTVNIFTLFSTILAEAKK